MPHRPEMLASAVRRVVASYARQIPPETSQMVAVTRVRVSPDLTAATVFITALSGAERAVRFLHTHQGVLKRELGSSVQLGSIPSLAFRVDEQVERAERIDRLLSE